MWDGLAVERDPGSAVVLVEAKSYPEESLTPCGISTGSLKLIKETLGRTAEWLGVTGHDEAVWLGDRYQSANRVAHLCLLREEWGIEAYLVSVCFVDDPHDQPTAEAEWREELPQQWADLGIHGEPPYTGAVFFPARPRSDLLT